jgi:hypothetical protein
MLSVKKELKIYRGTYAEIVALTTEDMAMYFAWDTQEIFVGNKYGVKTPYIGGNRLSEREIKEIVNSLVTDEVTLLRSQVLSTNVKALANETALEALTLRVEAVEGSNNEDIVNAVVALLTGDEGVLADYYTSEETNGAISAALGNFYTKAQVDVKFPDVEDFANEYIDLRDAVESLQNADSQYDSIKILSTQPLGDAALLDNIETIDDGIYTFTSLEGSEILIKNPENVVRLKPDGKFYYLSGTSWLVVPIDEDIVKSINSLTPVDNAIEIDQDDIPETSTKKFNNLLPQTDNAINPLGRNISFSVGEGSVAFGSGSAAQGENSVAIGLNSVSTGENSIQLGTGSNNTDNTLKFLDKEIINSDGKIPTERIIERFDETTLSIIVSD